MTALWSLFKTDHTVQQNRGGHGEKVPCLILLLPDFSKKGHENVQSRVRRSRRGGFFRSSPICAKQSIIARGWREVHLFSSMHFTSLMWKIFWKHKTSQGSKCKWQSMEPEINNPRRISLWLAVHTDINTYSPQTRRRRSCCPSQQLVTLFSVPAGSPAHFFPPPF